MLRDYRWKITGTTVLTADLTLSDPHFIATRVDYNPQDRIARIELGFTEGADGLYQHKRDFFLTLPDAGTESLGKENIAAFIAARFPTAQKIAGE